MKEKILSFITSVKKIFSLRKAAMPTMIHAHKRIIPEIESDENNLDSAYNTINQLDESDQKVFTSSLFFYLMEKVVPVFRNWMKRIHKIETAGKSDVDGHIKAFEQYNEMKQQIYTLVLEANSLSHEQFIQITPEMMQEPGKEIIKKYNRENYLAVHPVQNDPLNVTEMTKIKIGM